MSQDRLLRSGLQEDATQAYAALGKTVGLSAGATHERVRKLCEPGVIRITAVEVDPAAVGSGVLAFVMVDSSAWTGDSGERLVAIRELQEARIIAGSASVLGKVRTRTTEQLRDILLRLYEIKGVSGPQATVAVETLFERLASTGA
ncbi:Lrp/AsnC family transcriptional regulator [Streptomyces deccanensis]|uniref:Lrp/AsnC family transcriptional regulator n=1 Tax=Streptomyces deccanensis TaxID=424188 RepID=UPI001EFBE61B|nr:Lrp/AsnC family transcriptional regulator [Streptomyces deccanensis]ULR55827.1 Lrp/AsnC family transcriptional regulator [Streptomyces deccanensis]